MNKLNVFDKVIVKIERKDGRVKVFYEDKEEYEKRRKEEIDRRVNLRINCMNKFERKYKEEYGDRLERKSKIVYSNGEENKKKMIMLSILKRRRELEKKDEDERIENNMKRLSEKLKSMK